MGYAGPTKTRESVQAALARVLQSRSFSRSKHLRRSLVFTESPRLCPFLLPRKDDSSYP